MRASSVSATRGRLATAARAVTCAAACVALAGCSSSPSAQATAQAERSKVLPAARQLYTQVSASGVAWIGSIIGGYVDCGTYDPLATPASGTSVQYSASEEVSPFSRSAAYAAFKRQLVEALDGAGWHLRPGTGSSTAASYYVGQRDGFDLRLVEADLPTIGPQATTYISGSCFDAGSSAQQLTGKGTDYSASEPKPTATPTPQYS
jgi:hypothetical protein